MQAPLSRSDVLPSSAAEGGASLCCWGHGKWHVPVRVRWRQLMWSGPAEPDIPSFAATLSLTQIFIILGQVRSLILGPLGSAVNLSFRRPGGHTGSSDPNDSFFFAVALVRGRCVGLGGGAVRQAVGQPQPTMSSADPSCVCVRLCA